MDGLQVSLGTWSELALTGLHVLLIAGATWLALRLSGRLLGRLHRRMQQDVDDRERLKRLETLERVSRYVTVVLIMLVGILLALAELGISVAPVLATAGVVGIAIGFGAQSLVKDYFNGFFLLLENQVRVGDVVELAGKSGLVEEITLRYIRLRDYEGNVHYVPSGAVDTVTNRSRGFAYAVADIRVTYREDIDKTYGVMRDVAAGLRADPEFSDRIVDDLEIAGVDQWAESALVIRCRFKVMPLEQWAVRRAYLYRLKKAFDAAGIEIPYPHLTVYAGGAGDSGAPPAQPLQAGAGS